MNYLDYNAQRERIDSHAPPAPRPPLVPAHDDPLASTFRNVMHAAKHGVTVEEGPLPANWQLHRMP